MDVMDDSNHRYRKTHANGTRKVLYLFLFVIKHPFTFTHIYLVLSPKHFYDIIFRWKTLNEIDSGVCDDKTYEDVKNQWPQDFKARDVDKFRYRYPRGESYEDLVARLEPVIMELERQDVVVIVAHQAVNR